MNNLYIDCSMGAAGDMLTAALIELFPDKNQIVTELNAIGVPNVTFIAEESVKCGIVGTHMKVLVNGAEEESEDVHEHHHDHELEHEHEPEHHHHDHHHEHHHDHGHHHHTSMADIEHIVNDHLNVADEIKKDIIEVYNLIAEAESVAHGRPVTEIHFHEVGNMDAIADISAVCYLIRKLAPLNIVVSPVHVGSGQVKCAHGVLPVPAPATAYILKDVPTYGGNIKGELCTPTGAALLKHFATKFGSQPMMLTQKIGYGMGKKDFEAANCVRILIGEEFKNTDSNSNQQSDKILHLSCNVDDMTGEEIGFCTEKLFEAGARDVYTESVYMKKNRPGTVINVICTEQARDSLVKTIFKYSTTIGIREAAMNRYILDRTIETVETKYGPVRCKVSSGYGVERKKYEYDDLIKISQSNNLSISEITNSITKSCK